MRSVEVEGNSRVDATRRAIELLGADIDDVKVEVIKEEPRPLLGFLGFKKVTVRVTLLEENVLEEAGTIVQNILSRLPVPVEARLALQKDLVTITLLGHELRQFQKQEDVADALGHIIELILNKKTSRKISVKTAFPEDARSREEELVALAKAAAQKASGSGKPEGLPPMPPRERRLIHMTLEGDERVTTESVGKGDGRHVVVYPVTARPPARTPEDKTASTGRAQRPSRHRRKPHPSTPARLTAGEPAKGEGVPPKKRRPRRRTRPKDGMTKTNPPDTKSA